MSRWFQDYRFKGWERFVLVASLFLFVGSCNLFVSNFPLRRYLFGLDDLGELEKVGLLAQKAGILRRQSMTEGEFKEIETAAPLYNYDIVVTGTEGGATLEFERDVVVKLEPNTMVKIDFLEVLGLSGLNRMNRVQVISGAATAQAGQKKVVLRGGNKEMVAENSTQTLRVNTPPPPPPKPLPVVVASPSPSPSPSAVPLFTAAQAEQTKIVSPKGKVRIALDKGAKSPVKKLELQWRLADATGVAKATVTRRNEAGEWVEVFSGEAAAKKNKASTFFTVKEPGDYHWKIASPAGDPITTAANGEADFSVEVEFEGIEVLDPLIAGKTSTDNALRGELIKDFDITLRWAKYETANKYELWFGKSPKDKTPILSRTLTETEFFFNKNKVYAGQLYYKISAKLPSGFVATSGVQLFEFKFLPPILVVPEANAQVTHAQIAKEDNSLLFTWTKTNFTEGYEIEISRTPDFKKPLVKQNLRENFFVLANPVDGRYYWRVRSYSKQLSSPMSKSFAFDIVP